MDIIHCSERMSGVRHTDVRRTKDERFTASQLCSTEAQPIPMNVAYLDAKRPAECDRDRYL